MQFCMSPLKSSGVDVRTAQVIWNGDINFAERNNNSGDGLVGALVSAAITQVVRSKTDASHDAAIAANERWFQNSRDGLLIGFAIVYCLTSVS